MRSVMAIGAPHGDVPHHAQARAFVRDVGTPSLTAVAAVLAQAPQRTVTVTILPQRMAPAAELARVDLVVRDDAGARVFTYILVASRYGPDAIVEELYGPSASAAGRLVGSRQATLTAWPQLDEPALRRHVQQLYDWAETTRRRG
jgi:hypothetical protein